MLRPMLIHSDAVSARLCLVPDGALLLAGDRITIQVTVGDGVTLTLVEPTGTVAYDMAGGLAEWATRIELRDDARLAWATEPFIVSSGADVVRTTQVTLGAGARLAMREVIVLGRHGERPGRARFDWSAYDHTDRPLLVESLQVDERSSLPGVLGDHRVLSSVTALGWVPPAELASVGRLDLEHGGTTWRELAVATHSLSPLAWQVASDFIDPS